MFNRSKLAPIVLFVYNRKTHAERTIVSLAKNKLAKQSKLIIYSDAAKDEKSFKKVNEVRKYINSKYVRDSFLSVEIHEAESNQGLANSIINNVSSVMKKYGKAIVIEDDNESTSDFISFMNDCLEYYKDDNRIWSIGGYSRTRIPADYQSDVYIIGRTCSYAWASWQDRWDKVDWEVKDYLKFKYNIINRLKFDKYGNDRSNMLDQQMNKNIDSWAIRFCYAEFKNNMYTLLPCKSKISNFGHDGTGIHNSVLIDPSVDVFYVRLNGENPYKLSHDIELNKEIVKDFSMPFNCGLKEYWKRYLYNLIKL